MSTNFEYNRMRITYSILLLFFFLSPIIAQTGGEGYTFLRFPFSARANALGGHTVSLVERDPSLVFHNPALLGAEMDGMVNLNYMNHMADINVGSALFTKGVNDRSAWGVGISFISYGNFKETSADNTVLGSFTAKDIQVSGFYSRDLSERWRIGIALKALYSSLEQYTSFGIASDVGLSYYNSEKKFSAGITLKNAGAQLKAYEDTRQKLPWDVQLGISQGAKHAPFRFSLTAMYLTQWSFDSVNNIADADKKDDFLKTLAKHLVFGVDYVPSENFWLGVGFTPKRYYDMKLSGGNLLSGFSAGAGVRIRMFEVGVSVAKYHPSALSLMLSVSTTLSDLKKQ